MPTLFKANPLIGGELTKGPNPTYAVAYEASGETNPLLVEADARAHFSSTYDSMPLQEITVQEFGAGDDEWRVELLYAPDGYVAGAYTAPPETGDSLFTFDTGGGSQNITQNIATSYGDATGTNPVPDYKGAIGVTKNGVAGVDIVVPAFNFKETHYIAAAGVTDAYLKGLADLTGKVNTASFRQWAAGELLFMGASGSYREREDDWEIVFSFSRSENRSDIEIGDMTAIEKKGWEYLEVIYEEAIDAVAEVMVVEPIAVIVHQVYETASFAGLGI